MDEQKVWAGIRDYAREVFPAPRFKCTLLWKFRATKRPMYCISDNGRRLYGDGTWKFEDIEQQTRLEVCVFAHDHRQEFINGTIEGIETFEKYLHYCIHEVTGAGFVKSGYKK